jgi:hypothetical protein
MKPSHIFLVVTLLQVPFVHSSELSKTHDCTVLNQDVEVDPNLTNEENVKRLTDMFYDSVNTVVHCDPPSESSAAGGGGGGGGGGASASADLVGTEAVMVGQPSSTGQTTADATLDAVQSKIDDALKGTSVSDGSTDGENPVKKANEKITGASPEDIPPGNNDSVFEAQIRKAVKLPL